LTRESVIIASGFFSFFFLDKKEPKNQSAAMLHPHISRAHLAAAAPTAPEEINHLCRVGDIYNLKLVKNPPTEKLFSC